VHSSPQWNVKKDASEQLGSQLHRDSTRIFFFDADGAAAERWVLPWLEGLVGRWVEGREGSKGRAGAGPAEELLILKRAAPADNSPFC